MDNAGYITLSRQMALFRQMDVIANNIANANSTGYKFEKMLYNEYLVDKGAVNQSSFTSDVSTLRDMTQGPLRETGRQLDAAINGKGFFELETPLGTRYTRVGTFQIDPEGQLVNSQGYPVQSTSGPITLSEDDLAITIREDGTVFAARPDGTEEERGTLKVVKFENPSLLQKAGEGNYDAGDNVPENALVIEDFQVSQGMLEDSNVNSTVEMTEMITVNRAVSTTANFLKDINELQRKAITTLSRLD